MSVKNPQKTVSKTVLAPGETATVTLSFEACPEFLGSSADMVLAMDRSGSLSQASFAEAKASAKALIDTVARASGSPDGSQILNDSRMGLVSFADTASKDTGLTDDPAVLDAAVDAMPLGGLTNHVAAFDLARQMLENSTADRRIIIFFTDGITTVGDSPDAITKAIRAMGIEIFCIGLLPDASDLLRWASEPAEAHVASTNDTAQLARVFAEIASRVVLAGALNFRLEEVLNTGFQIVQAGIPSHGEVTVTGPGTLVWTGAAAGVTAPETVSLSFDVVYTGPKTGLIPVNHSLTDSDEQGAQLVFPSPEVYVNCEAILPEPCPEPVPVTVEGCRDAVRVYAGDTALSGLGRIIQVNALIKNVCPGRRAAAAILLSEVDDAGNELPRGMKTVLIPPQGGDACQDVLLRCISFVVPEELDSSGNTASICNPRSFHVRVLANYLDTDFMCCAGDTVLP